MSEIKGGSEENLNHSLKSQRIMFQIKVFKIFLERK